MRRLETDPRPQGAVQLQGTSGTLYRFREGDWRIIFTIEDDRLIVLVGSQPRRSTPLRWAIDQPALGVCPAQS